MKKLKISLLAFISGFALSNGVNAQKSNIETRNFEVSGNCGMCKKAIEKAARIPGVKNAAWDVSKKLLALKYDKRKTNPAAALRSVAHAGYDNEHYLAPNSAYEQLHGCCQYERRQKTTGEETENEPHSAAVTTEHKNHSKTTSDVAAEQAAPLKASGIETVYNGYFQIKDALVSSNATASAEAARSLLLAIDAVDVAAFAGNEREVVMSSVGQLQAIVKAIAATGNIEQQRARFSALSELVIGLMRQIEPRQEVFLAHCPMYADGKGADWVSKEKQIKNPYYGSKMLSCGSVKETIKQHD